MSAADAKVVSVDHLVSRSRRRIMSYLTSLCHQPESEAVWTKMVK